jgi:hypothetical protein
MPYSEQLLIQLILVIIHSPSNYYEVIEIPQYRITIEPTFYQDDVFVRTSFEYLGTADGLVENYTDNLLQGYYDEEGEEVNNGGPSTTQNN